jgi:hypothetical protein
MRSQKLNFCSILQVFDESWVKQDNQEDSCNHEKVKPKFQEDRLFEHECHDRLGEAPNANPPNNGKHRIAEGFVTLS